MISLEAVKKHLNLPMDFVEDDEYIMSLLQVATETVERDIDRHLIEIQDGEIPGPLLQAILLLIGHLYQNREIVGVKTTPVPYAYQYLLDLYRHYN